MYALQGENDYFLTITESRKRFNEESYERHKIFLYKEDFNKFQKGLNDAVDYVKTELMPDFDFDAFNHDFQEGEPEPVAAAPLVTPEPLIIAGFEPTSALAIIEEEKEEEPVTLHNGNGTHEEVDKW